MCSERFRCVIAALISSVTFYECWQVMLAESFRRKTRNGKKGVWAAVRARRGEDEARGGVGGGALLNDRFSVKHHSSQKKG